MPTPASRTGSATPGSGHRRCFQSPGDWKRRPNVPRRPIPRIGRTRHSGSVGLGYEDADVECRPGQSRFGRVPPRPGERWMWASRNEKVRGSNPLSSTKPAGQTPSWLPSPWLPRAQARRSGWSRSLHRAACPPWVWPPASLRALHVDTRRSAGGGAGGSDRGTPVNGPSRFGVVGRGPAHADSWVNWGRARCARTLGACLRAGHDHGSADRGDVDPSHDHHCRSPALLIVA